nr:putative lipid II flippase FtsW [Rhodococcus sp. HNM0569]
MSDFHLITAATLLLLGLGLVMVLSSSAVESYVASGSSYTRFVPQVMYAAIGLVLFVAVVRLPTRTVRTLAPWGLGIALIALVAVLMPGIGSEQMGARSWIMLGSVGFQPSEFAKVVLVVWGAHLIASALSTSSMQAMAAFKPLMIGSLVIMALVVAERDLGQTATIGAIVMALLWFGQFPTRLVGAIALGAVIAFVILATTAAYRSDRIRAFLNPAADPQGLNYQATQARFALAHGGLFGTGLGQGQSKWSYLPQAYNDFIFAVVGEELGLFGGLLVIALFAIVLWVGLRISQRARDPFLRVMSATATVFVVAQAAINIAYVVGLVPITGLQLPLISAGGTSMIATLVMFGLIAHAALREPEAITSLNTDGKHRWLTRIFGTPTPQRFTQRRTPAPQRYPRKQISHKENERRRRVDDRRDTRTTYRNPPPRARKNNRTGSSRRR